MKNIYELKLHETTRLSVSTGLLSSIDVNILRVPGGWIYYSYPSNERGIFVPLTYTDADAAPSTNE
jgi:hypothetical protein